MTGTGLSRLRVRTMLRSVKGIAIILYLELWRSTDFSSGSISMEEALTQKLREAYEAREVPGTEFFPHLLASERGGQCATTFSDEFGHC